LNPLLFIVCIGTLLQGIAKQNKRIGTFVDPGDDRITLATQAFVYDALVVLQGAREIEDVPRRFEGFTM
jgi:hypothetical protein